VTTGSALYCWGSHSHGQLGDGSQTSSSSPVLVAGDFLFQVARAGSYHTCGVTTANVAYCWGYDLYGQLGTGSVAIFVPTPVAVAGDHSFAAVATGYSHSCGTATDGAAYCWGQASLLGDESGLDQSAPVAVAGGSAVAYCWGINADGEVGATVLDECVADATYPCALAPVRVVGTVQAGASAARVLGRAARPRTADRVALLRELEAGLRRTPLNPLPLKAP